MKRTNRGFTLIEVMIAMLVMSLGLLGIAATLVTAMHSATSNYLKQQAVQTAYDMADRMRSNFKAASTPNSSNPYIVAMTPPAAGTPSPDCSAAVCTATNMAAYDVWQWKTSLKNNLPGGLGSISVIPDPATSTMAQVTITVQWSDQPAQATFSAASPATPATFSVVTQL